MSNRWCIWIDIEGFTDLYRDEAHAVSAVGRLLDGVCQIGLKCYSDDQKRLFAHHLGDGVALLSNGPEADLGRCASIAVALMRHVTSARCFARAGIAEGDAADIHGLYPKNVRDAEDDDGVVRLGSGLLTLTTVMGTAQIRSYSIQRGKPRGPLLLTSKELAERIPSSFPRQPIRDGGVVSIDWVRAESPHIDTIREKTQLFPATPASLASLLDFYLKQQPQTPDDWVATARSLVRGEPLAG